MRKVTIGTTILAMMFSLFFLGASTSKANEASLESFSVAIETPASQQNDQSNYFDLLLDQGADETLRLSVTNNRTEPIQLDLSFHRAITNALGVVEYSGVNEDLNDDLAHDIEDYVTLSADQLLLDPGATQVITAEVKMPEESFSGKIAGGFYIEEIKENENNQSIQHIFSREIALLLAESPEAVTPNLVIGEADVTQMNRRNGVALTLENPEGAFLNQLAISYELSHEGESIATGDQSGMQLAPHTKFAYYIPLAEEDLAPGEYELAVQGSTADNQWQEVRTFTVNPQAARELNETNVGSTQAANTFPTYLIVLIIVLVLVVLFIGYKYFQLKKKVE